MGLRLEGPCWKCVDKMHDKLVGDMHVGDYRPLSLPGSPGRRGGG